jgi:GH15 family glucan-1,4-alpha-glucosidase
MVQLARDLIDASLAVLRAGQGKTGAFIASPHFSVYRYCWFRDGTFIAHALDLWEDHEAAHRFYGWGVDVIRRQEHTVEAALATPAGEMPTAYLHTRYALDGAPGDDEWPNFQLDGFGTFLWGLVEHLEATAVRTWPAGWADAVHLLTRYIGHLWRLPNYDCWEEFPDKVHIATLCALSGGLRAVGRYGDDQEARRLGEDIRRVILDIARPRGHLPKFVGTDAVDGSLLWASIPFGLLAANDPLMMETAARIRNSLVGPHGGVHRYAVDSYYGGGAWLLLTALLGEYLLQVGESAAAFDALRWIEEQAGATGEMPEQVPVDLLAPAMYQPWVERWGPVADPLLWSHAAYLRLRRALDNVTASAQ